MSAPSTLHTEAWSTLLYLYRLYLSVIALMALVGGQEGYLAYIKYCRPTQHCYVLAVKLEAKAAHSTQPGF